MYNIAFLDFRNCQQAQLGANVSPAMDTTIKVDKDTNFTILTSKMYKNVNKLKAENWRI